MVTKSAIFVWHPGPHTALNTTFIISTMWKIFGMNKGKITQKYSTLGIFQFSFIMDFKKIWECVDDSFKKLLFQSMNDFLCSICQSSNKFRCCRNFLHMNRHSTTLKSLFPTLWIRKMHMDGDVKQFSNLLIYCCHMNTIGSVTVISQITFKASKRVQCWNVWIFIILHHYHYITSQIGWNNINIIKNRNFTATNKNSYFGEISNVNPVRVTWTCCAKWLLKLILNKELKIIGN